MIDVYARLEELARLRDERATATAELDKQIAELEYQRTLATVTIDQDIKEVEDEIRKAGENLCQTVKGSVLMAVWNKPTWTYDKAGLDGYAVAHREIEAFRKPRAGYVTIREVKR